MDALLTAVENLSTYHREHDKHYAEAPLREALELQRISRTLQALAERWTTVAPGPAPVPVPFAGAPDLNDDRAIEESGVLFMEGEEAPAEIARMRRDLETMAADHEQTADWLSNAMETAWGAATALLS